MEIHVTQCITNLHQNNFLRKINPISLMTYLKYPMHHDLYQNMSKCGISATCMITRQTWLLTNEIIIEIFGLNNNMELSMEIAQ